VTMQSQGGGNTATLIIRGETEGGRELYTRTREAAVGETLTITAESVSGYTLADGQSRSVRVTIEEGVNTVTFYYKASSTTPTTGRLTVTVEDENGAAVSGAEVIVRSGSTTAASGATGRDGTLSWDGLAFGSYTITATKDAYTEATGTARLSATATDVGVTLAMRSVAAELTTSSLTITGVTEEGEVLYTRSSLETIGEVLAITAEEVEGYVLADGQEPEVRITIEDGENLVSFLYTKTEEGAHLHKAYITGYPEGDFKPDGSMTRAEAAIIFYRLLDEPEVTGSAADRFSDVEAGNWYDDAVNHLSLTGVIEGYPEGTFKPYDSITRAEFSAIAARFTDTNETGQVSFTDVDSGHWAIGYISNAAYYGWVNGYPEGDFKPDENISRAEAVTIINRVLERHTEERDVPQEYVALFPDVDMDNWAYADIIEAAVDHFYEKDDIGNETWIEVE